MNSRQANKSRKKIKRTYRVRKKLRGTALKPRLCVVKSISNLHAQLIDDENGLTLGSVSTISKESKKANTTTKNSEVAKKLGELMGEKINKLKIKEVCFDRGYSKYHGVLAAFAEGTRSTGVKF